MFVVIDNIESSSRIDKLIATKLEISRESAKRIIKLGVRINGLLLHECDKIIKPGDLVEIQQLPGTQSKCYAQPKQMPLDIVYEDEYLIVLNKPAGLTVHPGNGNHTDTLVNGLVHYLGSEANLSSIGESDRPGIVHRLDKDTSGLMMVAKTDLAHMRLAKQISNRTVHREYITYVWGVMTPLHSTIDKNISRCTRDRTKMMVTDLGGRTAVTHYSTIYVAKEGLFSKLKVKLETGRTHQIRVHMAYKKHQVIGDQVYGKNKNHNLNNLTLDEKTKILLIKRQALHSHILSFVHPITTLELSFTAPLPQDLLELDQIATAL